MGSEGNGEETEKREKEEGKEKINLPAGGGVVKGAVAGGVKAKFNKK